MSDEPTSEDGDETTGPRPTESPRWEKILGLVGGVLLVAIIVLVLTGDDSPAVVTTEVTTTRTTSSFVIHEVEVRNDGGETVEDVVVIGELLDSDGTVVATSEATVTFLPGGGSEQVALAFERDPEVYDLTVRAVGWSDA